jgi:hypothetical protein
MDLNKLSADENSPPQDTVRADMRKPGRYGWPVPDKSDDENTDNAR